MYRQTSTQSEKQLALTFSTKLCSIFQSISNGISFCEAQDAHLDWKLIGEAVGHIALTNISSTDAALGIYLNSPATIKFARLFVEKYYTKFLAEFDVATSIYDPSKLMKNNVGAVFESLNEKKALVWDYIVSQAMEKEDLPMWKCANLVLMSWELVIATADTVHFGSRYPNSAISDSKAMKRNDSQSVNFRIHHYLGSQEALRSEEVLRGDCEDCGFNTSIEDGGEMITSEVPDSTVVSRQF